jgi:uncharacterized membrane protein
VVGPKRVQDVPGAFKSALPAQPHMLFLLTKSAWHSRLPGVTKPHAEQRCDVRGQGVVGGILVGVLLTVATSAIALGSAALALAGSHGVLVLPASALTPVPS